MQAKDASKSFDPASLSIQSILIIFLLVTMVQLVRLIEQFTRVDWLPVDFDDFLNFFDFGEVADLQLTFGGIVTLFAPSPSRNEYFDFTEVLF